MVIQERCPYLDKKRIGILFKFLLVCQIASPEPHSVVYTLSGATGLSDLPEFWASGAVDGVEAAYCDSNIKNLKVRTVWMKKLLENDPEHLKWLKNKCIHNWLNFQEIIADLTQQFNQSGGVHVFQRANGCFWDDETKEFDAFNQYGYDGEDLISLDLKTLTWITPRNQTVITKDNWNSDGQTLFWNDALTVECKNFLQMYLNYTKNFSQPSVLPSVSLLQKTPSSVVTCHATGFYPERATMFWRKDGEVIQEGVNQGEILPNNDGTFQMSVDLNISSVKADNWKSYDCVFGFPSFKDKVTTKLDRVIIKTNQVSSLRKYTGVAIAAGIFLLLLAVLVSAAVFVTRRRNRNGLL